MNFLTCLSVPELDVPVVATAEELCARVVEGDVPHGLFVTAVGPHTAPVVVHLPDLHKEKVDKCQALCKQYVHVSQLYIEVETMQKLPSFSKFPLGKPFEFLDGLGCGNLINLEVSVLKLDRNFK